MPAVYLLRHGQASFGGPDYDVLSPVGEQQAKILGAELTRRGPKVHSVWSGTLRRQRETAAACLPADLAATVREDDRFDEYDHLGLVAARPAAGENFQDQLDAALLDWLNGNESVGSSGTWREFSTRATSAVADVADGLPKGTSALVFTSAGVIAAVCAGILDLPPAGFLALNRTMANCGISKLVAGRSGTSLVSINEHGHFEGSNRELLTYR